MRYRCPVCDNPMLRNGATYVCINHGLVIDPASKKAHLNNNAPDWMRESFTFLSDFKAANPVIALSPVHPFTEGFSIDKCWFIGCVNSVYTRSRCVPFGPQVPNDTKMRNLTLIGMMGNVAKFINTTAHAQMCVGVDRLSVLSLQMLDPDQYLFMWCLEHSAYTGLDSDRKTCLYMYFCPTAEEQVEWFLHHRVCGNVRMSPEQLLYVYTFVLGDIQKPWTASVSNMKAYVKHYLLMLTAKSEPVTEEYKHSVIETFSTALKSPRHRQEYIESALNSSLHTCYNDGAWYNVRYGSVDPGIIDTAKSLTQETFANMYFTFTFFNTLLSKLFKEQSHYGIKYKVEFLKKECGIELQEENADEVVYTYWSEVHKLLGGK